jgi:hypothetical protein
MFSYCVKGIWDEVKESKSESGLRYPRVSITF